MALTFYATLDADLPSVEGWGWAQESAETQGTGAYADADLPTISLFGSVSDNLQTFPAFSLTASGQRVSYGGTFTVPAFNLTAYGGGTQQDATLNLSATIAGTADGLGRTVNLNVDIRLPYIGSVIVPKFTLTGVGRTEQYGQATPRFTRFTLSGYGAGNASMDFPPFTVDTVGLSEERGSLVDGDACGFNNIFPLCMWSVTASGTHEEQGQLEADMPEFSVITNIPAVMDIPAFHVHAEAA